MFVDLPHDGAHHTEHHANLASEETSMELAMRFEERIASIQNRLETNAPTGLSNTDNIAYVIKLLAKDNALGLLYNIFGKDDIIRFTHSFLTGNLNSESGLADIFYEDLFSLSGILFTFFQRVESSESSIARLESLVEGFEDQSMSDKIISHGNKMLRMMRKQNRPSWRTLLGQALK